MSEEKEVQFHSRRGHPTMFDFHDFTDTFRLLKLHLGPNFYARYEAIYQIID